jgi:DUF1680 family protein
VEAADHGEADVRDLVLPDGAQLSAAYQADLLGGVVTLRGQATLAPDRAAWHGRLYGTAQPAPATANGAIAELTAIPYFAWANREPGQMLVWVQAG